MGLHHLLVGSLEGKLLSCLYFICKMGILIGVSSKGEVCKSTLNMKIYIKLS